MTGHSLKLWYVAEWCMWLKFLHMYFMSRQGPSWIRGYCVLCTRLYLCNVVYFQKSNGIIPVVLTREQQANVCCLTLAWAQLFHVHVRAHSFISFNAFGTETVGCWGMPTEPYWNACKSHYYSPNFLLICSACVGSVHDFVGIQFYRLWASSFLEVCLKQKSQEV